MTRELTLYAFDAATGLYLSPVTKSLEDWGIDATVSGSFRSQNADQLTLTFSAAAFSVSQFTYRSKIQFSVDGKCLFAGYVPDETKIFSGDQNQSVVRALGPWWFLENLVYMQTFSILSSYDADGNPVFANQELTHFTLNQSLTATTPNGGLLYTPTSLNSAQQIAAVLDYAITQGAWLQYSAAEIMAVPVLPRDVLNITCAVAIRRQMEDVDCVAWFDYTTEPPTFRCKQRKDLPSVVRTLGDAYQVQGFSLKRRYDLAVPSVRIDFEQQNSLNGNTSLSVTSDIYPVPAPAARFKALIVSVPLRGSSAQTVRQYIKTAPIQMQSLDFWRARKPELDKAVNRNADDEYSALQLLAGTDQRQSILPNMIVDGAWANYMPGKVEPDNLTVQMTYERLASSKVGGDKVAKHTLRARVVATDLNYPNGIFIAHTDLLQAAEDPNDFLGLAQIIYTDLNTPSYEGSIPLFFEKYDAAVGMGMNLNLANSLAEHATMNALIQDLTFTSKPGCLFMTAGVGPNKNISPGALADRLRAKRLAYITAVTFFKQAGSNVAMPQTVSEDNVSSAEPLHSRTHVVDDSKKGGIVADSNQGKPRLILQTYDAATGSAKPGTVTIEQEKTTASDGKTHDLTVREEKVYMLVNGVCKQRTKLILCSETFQAPDDPA